MKNKGKKEEKALGIVEFIQKSITQSFTLDFTRENLHQGKGEERRYGTEENDQLRRIIKGRGNATFEFIKKEM